MATWLEASIPTWAPRALLALMLSLPSLAGAQAPPAVDNADAIAKAEQHAARAFEAYQQGRHADAVALYEKAYASAPSADALYNIARVYDVGLHDRARAIAAYERCLLEPGASAERLARAGERIAQLRSSEARTLPAKSWPADERVLVPPPQPPPDQPAPRAGWSWLRGASVVSGAAGVVGLGVGIGFGVAATADARRANAACDGNLCRSQQGVDAAESASTRATLATVGVGAGVALLASSATLWLLSDEGPRNDGDGVATERERVPQPGVSLTPVAGTRELGLAVEGRW